MSPETQQNALRKCAIKKNRRVYDQGCRLVKFWKISGQPSTKKIRQCCIVQDILLIIRWYMAICMEKYAVWWVRRFIFCKWHNDPLTHQIYLATCLFLVGGRMLIIHWSSQFIFKTQIKCDHRFHLQLNFLPLN